MNESPTVGMITPRHPNGVPPITAQQLLDKVQEFENTKVSKKERQAFYARRRAEGNPVKMGGRPKGSKTRQRHSDKPLGRPKGVKNTKPRNVTATLGRPPGVRNVKPGKYVEDVKPYGEAALERDRDRYHLKVQASKLLNQGKSPEEALKILGGVR